MELVQEKSLLSVVLPSNTLINSPSASYLADEVASTCPLLTPSPPTNALVNPPSEQAESPIPAFLVGDELDNLTIKLNQVKDETTADTSSSNSSVLAEPACAQLLNPHHYMNLSKNPDGNTIQENGVKPPNLQLTFKKSYENMCFMGWNWPLLRRMCAVTCLTSVFAAVALVVAMIVSLPKTCNPDLPWYQGSLLYEVFPASFQDSNRDGIGDFKGLMIKSDYIQSLGVRGVRLNSIFPATHYPEYFHNITTLFDVDHNLGTMSDFEQLVNTFHLKGIYIILDLPIWPLVTKFQPIRRLKLETYNESRNDVLSQDGEMFDSRENFVRVESYDEIELADKEDTITSAIRFWLDKGVDGFYLKGLEKFSNDPFFRESVREWKLMMGTERILIVDYKVFEYAPVYDLNVLLTRVDLVDVKLDFSNGTESVRKQIEMLQSGPLWSRPGAPWVHWSTGNVDSKRLSSSLPRQNATLGALLLQMMLPGTPSLFYGDEIGITEVNDPEKERYDLKHVHQLSPMAWEKPEKQFTKNHLPWLPGAVGIANYNDVRVIAKMVDLRINSPAIYINAIWKEGISSHNAAVRYAENGVMVIERWFPRRNSYVVVSNLEEIRVTVDLSALFYSGTVMVGPRYESKSHKVSFKHINLYPGESVVVKLDK